MSSPQVALIRRFRPSDDKLVRFVIGKANFELLASANRKAYSHPFVVSAWLVLSSIFIDYMQWWPNHHHGWYGYLSPLPAMASTAVPIMFLIDWLNRRSFEPHAQDALRGPDMSDLDRYYSIGPSAFWILDYGDQFVGLIAVDASHPGEPSTTITDTPTATIRHFYVDEAYRGSGIQADLVSHAVRSAFNSDPKLQRICTSDSALVPYIRTSLREAGFTLHSTQKRLGVFGWKYNLKTLVRGDWERRVTEN